MESMVIIAGYLIVDEADRAEYAHRDLVGRARAYEGRIDLAISADALDPRRVNNVEVWESAAALDAWRAQADPPDHGIATQEGRMQRFDATDGGPLF